MSQEDIKKIQMNIINSPQEKYFSYEAKKT